MSFMNTNAWKLTVEVGVPVGFVQHRINEYGVAARIPLCSLESSQYLTSFGHLQHKNMLRFHLLRLQHKSRRFPYWGITTNRMKLSKDHNNI